MAKILFISDNLLDEGLGIMSLSSYVKSKGHQTDLSLLTDFSRAEDLFKRIDKVNPDLIAFSLMTPQVTTFRPITQLIKQNSHRKIIWGGPHCMFMAEDVSQKESVDFICVGEGEETLLTLMNCLDDRSDYSGIPNLWIKNDSGWIKNPIGHLEENLDKYPAPDRALYYDKYPILRSFAVKRFMTQRGCPYTCSYCFEPSYKIMYKGKGKLMRRTSVDWAINEIKEVTKKYPTRLVHMADDVFNLNKDWVREFLKKYKQNIDLPFTCNVVVQGMDEDLIKSFKDAGCRGVTFGLETGVESTRMNMLQKKTSNKIFLDACKNLRKHKLNYLNNIMFCLPNEDLDHALESVRFNIELKPFGARACILKMYKGTELANTSLRNGLCEGVGEFTYKAKDLKNEHHILQNMIWACVLFVRFPFLFRFARQILSSRIFKLLNKPLMLYIHWQDVQHFKIPIWQAIRFFYMSREVFLKGQAGGQDDVYNKLESQSQAAAEPSKGAAVA